jgi:hypothetical protein
VHEVHPKVDFRREAKPFLTTAPVRIRARCRPGRQMTRLPCQKLGQADFGCGPAGARIGRRTFLIGLTAVSDGDLVEGLDAMAPEYIGFACAALFAARR